MCHRKASKNISLLKTHFNKTRALTGGKNRAGRPTRQADQQGRQANKAGRPTRPAAGSIDALALPANIFAAANNRTNIHNMTGSTYI